ncbi:hypothetical protein A2188_00780 [Candidatus Woesebacteria bacterium RIFOXYA1_FULL_43_9]|uniref:Metallo-beta-lactamase domain-containing protein n=1 Tax=Candidatus Woesebacteria bacterium RIFOXYA1_FULL_43_9 TaxID=1802534 RepID=A0A1F8CMN4_9BACT|nr:MAG: hypothetical protein A2188_00780 [Candidatus Woesebacteria bacterium RIFOXYA1_FULL_43_9]
MLRFIAISGTTGVAENHYVYEYTPEGASAPTDMIVVDAGVGFPDAEMYGVDLVIPDFSYVLKNQKILRGVFITHGHEDHLGGLPFLYKDLQTRIPIYATKLVAGFIQDKFEDYKKDVEVKIIDPEHDTITAGPFKVQAFRVSHSVPDSIAFVLDTPEGKFFHVSDFKFDWTPVDGRPFDVRRAVMLAGSGVTAMCSDCLGSTTPGYTESEIAIEKRVKNIVTDAVGRVYFTTISSNISRMQQALNAAEATGRKVAFIGRSVDKKAQIAQSLGYLTYPSGVVVSAKDAEKLPRASVMYVISGCYGQVGSALYRLALGEHQFLKIEKDDLVVFSADPAPPGSKQNVDSVVDTFLEKEIDVHYYDMQEDLHVSGHGTMEDIKLLMSLIAPKYYIPLGGTVRHMKAYSRIAQSLRVDEKCVFDLKEGESIVFRGETGIRGKTEDVKSVLVDGLGIGDVGNIVLRDRQVLAKEGVAIVILQVDKKQGKLVDVPDIISRGFVFSKVNQKFLNEAAERLVTELNRGRIDRSIARNKTIDFLERYFYDSLKRRPMVMPVVVEV